MVVKIRWRNGREKSHETSGAIIGHQRQGVKKRIEIRKKMLKKTGSLLRERRKRLRRRRDNFKPPEEDPIQSAGDTVPILDKFTAVLVAAGYLPRGAVND